MPGLRGLSGHARQGFEVMVHTVAPEIVNIVDTTDHASGTRPFYQVRDGESHG